MRHIVFVGCSKNCIEIFEPLIQAGYCLSFSSNIELSASFFDLMVFKLSGSDQLATIKRVSTPWIAWCSSNQDDLPTLAYQNGALAVFLDGTPFSVVSQIIQRTAENLTVAREIGSNDMIQRRYLKGDIILLEPQAVLEIQQGIIAQTMVYQDGSGVLLGLCGPQQVIIPHPTDTCYIQLVSHTDSIVSIRSWESSSQISDFVGKLRSRLQQLEAWAAIQARPHLDQRVTGILSLLAEQFGVDTPDGRLVDVRITHTQLALAVGATRATITRTLGDLRRQGVLTVVMTSDGERYCLSRWEHGDHCFHLP
jgi:hypothetical protein